MGTCAFLNNPTLARMCSVLHLHTMRLLLNAPPFRCSPLPGSPIPHPPLVSSLFNAQSSVHACPLLRYEELGMEAIWKVEVENFPAFIVVDNKGNDFFAEWQV